MQRKRRRRVQRRAILLNRRKKYPKKRKKRIKQKGRGFLSDLGENAKYIFNSWRNYSRRNSLLNVHVP